MTGYTIAVSDTITEEQRSVLDYGLNAFNDEMSGVPDRLPFSVTVRCDETGKTLGGILGRTSLGVLFIDLTYLSPEIRGQGLGTTLLQKVEEEGRRRGCVAAFLYTINFQAPEFYRRFGWEEFGRIDCLPEGIQRIFMKKDLRI